MLVIATERTCPESSGATASPETSERDLQGELASRSLTDKSAYALP